MDENIELVELFFQMEEKYRLFELRTTNGFPAWDILRNYVWDKINFPDYYPKTKTPVALKVKNFFRCLSSVVRFVFTNNNNFFFAASRFRNHDGQYYDPYLKSVKELLDNNCIIYESTLNQGNYLYKNSIFSFIQYYRRFAGVFSAGHNKISITNNDKLVILSAIENTFGYQVFSDKDIQKELSNFYIDHRFYGYLFRQKKIRKVFINQNGYQKGLMKAAYDLDIPVFEFQHGEIVDSTIVWNYGNPQFKKHPAVIAPTVFFTYASIWSKSNFIPSDCVELGSEFFNTNIQKGTNPDTITIISSKEHQAELEELTLKLAEADKSKIFYFKLHPGQFDQLENYRNYFKKSPNVQIVSTEMTIRDMISISEVFIAIYSTAIFEVLQAGKILLIYKRINYRFFKKYFNLQGVYLFDNAAEAHAILNTNYACFSSREIPQFFKPFNPDIFKATYKKYN